jgi:hypothetical protein
VERGVSTRWLALLAGDIEKLAEDVELHLEGE